MTTVDLHNASAFETVFPELLVDFLTRVNFTQDGEEVYDLLVELARKLGFRDVAYEFCDDVDDPDAVLVQRSSFSAAFSKLDALLRPHMRINYGRWHARLKWTPGIAGYEFADMYEDHPDYVKKLRLATIVPGFCSGFGVPLRSPNPKARAGIAFAGKLKRAECEAVVREHGATVVAICWAAHARILQHAREGRGLGVQLTDRQLDYIRHLADGLLDKQIAFEMDISHSGVRKHQRAVCKKLGVSRRVDIVPMAIRRGILAEPEIDMAVHADSLWSRKVYQGQP